MQAGQSMSGRFLIRRIRKSLEAVEEIWSGRQQVLEQHNRITRLYTVISGNVSGSRMDLETFVQRYYLERIFMQQTAVLEMSAGQFELRMLDEKKAAIGKGKKRTGPYGIFKCNRKESGFSP